MFTCTPLQSDADLRAVRELVQRLGERSSMVDFEEMIQMHTVRHTLRLWRQGAELAAFALVDDWNNLYFDTASPEPPLELEDEIVAWGRACIRQRNRESGEENTLDFACSPRQVRRLELLARHGFIQQEVRTLRYARSLAAPIEDAPFPAGFSCRPVSPADSLQALVDLHRAAFGTDNMTLEERQAIMNAPGYVPELDLLAVAPDGSLAAFCICGFDDEARQHGFTDPIGTHQRWQRRGLGRALVTEGLRRLRAAGAAVASLGTSSQNTAMQALAARLGFELVSEGLWFSKSVE